MKLISNKSVILLICISLFFIGVGILSSSTVVMAEKSNKMVEREQYYKSIGYLDYTGHENEFVTKYLGNDDSLIFSFGFRDPNWTELPIMDSEEYIPVANVLLDQPQNDHYVGSLYQGQDGEETKERARYFNSGAMVIDAQGKRVINPDVESTQTVSKDRRTKTLLGNRSKDKAVLLINEGDYLLEMEMKGDSNMLAVKTDIHYWNQSGKKLKYGIYYGHDFKLGSDDEVPIYSLGRNRGVYTKTDAEIDPLADQYRLNYIFKRSKFEYPDLVNYQVGHTDRQTLSSDNPFEVFSNKTFTGLGLESEPNDVDRVILNGEESNDIIDSALISKVIPRDVKANEKLTLSFTTSLAVMDANPEINPENEDFEMTEGDASIEILGDWYDENDPPKGTISFKVKNEKGEATGIVGQTSYDGGNKDSGEWKVKLEGTEKLPVGRYQIETEIKNTKTPSKKSSRKIGLIVKESEEPKLEILEKEFEIKKNETGQFIIKGKWQDPLKKGGKIKVINETGTIADYSYPAGQREGNWELPIDQSLFSDKKAGDYSLDIQLVRNSDNASSERETVAVHVLKRIIISYYLGDTLMTPQPDELKKEADIRLGKNLEFEVPLEYDRAKLNQEKSGTLGNKYSKKVVSDLDEVKIYYDFSTVKVTVNYLYSGTERSIFSSTTSAERKKADNLTDISVGSRLTDVVTDKTTAVGYDYESLKATANGQEITDGKVPNQETIINLYFKPKSEIKVPKSIDFGSQKLSKQVEKIYPKNSPEISVINTQETLNGDLVNWRLLGEFGGFRNEELTLLGHLKFADKGISSNSEVKVMEQRIQPEETILLNAGEQGLYLEVESGNLAEIYRGEITWILENAF
ncbi:hypothetical protein [Vagococcus sp.]|uniref:hypothetical protein n=1 Tax=Vagococcus sp. TaxID=1933889 RepID=UPI003F9B4F9F